MRWIYRVQQYVSLTPHECTVLLVLGALLGAGLFQRYWRTPDTLTVDSFYEEADRQLREGAALPEPTASEPADPGSTLRASAYALAATQPPAYPLDLNTATAADLETLPRVGPATAARIIAHRETHGHFRRVRDLLDVKGIGEKTLARFDSLVTVSSLKTEDSADKE